MNAAQSASGSDSIGRIAASTLASARPGVAGRSSGATVHVRPAERPTDAGNQPLDTRGARDTLHERQALQARETNEGDERALRVLCPRIERAHESWRKLLARLSNRAKVINELGKRPADVVNQPECLLCRLFGLCRLCVTRTSMSLCPRMLLSFCHDVALQYVEMAKLPFG
jgi:hypothetical protein